MAHHGAIAFWDKIVKKVEGDSSGTPSEYHWLEAIHDRDYRDYEIGKSNPLWFFQPTSAAVWPNSMGPGLAHSVPKPAGITVNEGYLHDANSYSPLAKRRANEEGKAPVRGFGGHLLATGPHTCQTSVSISALPIQDDPAIAKALIGLPSSDGSGGYLNPVRLTGDFPFTMECWVKGANYDGTSPGVALAVGPWLDPDNTGTSQDPAASWRFLGVGFSTSPTGGGAIPAALWGGFESLLAPTHGGSSSDSDSDLWQAFPDPDLTRGTDGSSWIHNAGANPTWSYYPGVVNEDDQWHHLVLVVHGAKHLQLYYDGRCVMNCEDRFWGVNDDIYSGDSYTIPFDNTTSGDLNSADRSPFSFSDFSSSQPMAMYIGGLSHHYKDATSGDAKVNTINTMNGDVAACATYDRALSSGEVLDHYVTMTQAFTIKLLSDSTDGTTTSGSGTGAHTAATWVGPHGVREITQPNTWGTGNADTFGMFHDRLWRDPDVPTMEFLVPGGKAALACSSLAELAYPGTTPTLDGITQVESGSQSNTSDSKPVDLLVGENTWKYSYCFGWLICATPIYVCPQDTPEFGPAYPWKNVPTGEYPSWVGSSANTGVAAGTWGVKLFDTFGTPLEEPVGYTGYGGSTNFICRDDGGTTDIHHWYQYGSVVDQHIAGSVYDTSPESPYEGKVYSVTNIEDRRFNIFSIASTWYSLYSQFNGEPASSVDFVGTSAKQTYGSVRVHPPGDITKSHGLRMFEQATPGSTTQATDTAARGNEIPMMRIGPAAYFNEGILPSDVPGKPAAEAKGKQKLFLSTLERAIRGHPPLRTRMSTQAPRRWFQTTRMALPRNTRTRLSERQS
jgi:hypothetical protein